MIFHNLLLTYYVLLLDNILHMNWYDLHRMRLNFRFENPDKCRSIHSELFMYIVDLWNRLWQKEKFWLPTEMTMSFLHIWSYNTYHKAYTDLVSRWFVKEVQKSTNQYSARVVAISKIDKATDKALDKATMKATDETSDETTDMIDKQLTTNNLTTEQWEEKKSKFIKPKLEEIKEYCIERKNRVDPQRFIDYYDSIWWMVWKNKMKDWKATIRWWEVRDKNNHKKDIKEYEKKDARENFTFM